MTVDIFQYSNMYTLRKSIQWLADEAHVKEECGTYKVWAIPDWSKLLHLYSRMRPGTTVVEWMQDHDVRSIGIDVRRFASFGVIKVPPIQFTRAPMYLTFVWQGFLHRARRWPILQADGAQHTETMTTTLPPSPIGPRKCATSLTVPPLASSFSVRAKRRTSDEMLAFATVSVHSTSVTVSLPPRAAEASLGTFRSRGSGPPSRPQTMRARHAAATPASLFEITQTLALPPPVRPRLSCSPSSPVIKTQTNSGTALPCLCWRRTLWPIRRRWCRSLMGSTKQMSCAASLKLGGRRLEDWLVAVGGGSSDGDFGKVLIIYR
ncbi:hypothetical protein V8E53_001447 [Lactarius tabidus]